jgi:hypothetical protein
MRGWWWGLLGVACASRASWYRAIDAAAPFDGVAAPEGAVRAPGAWTDGRAGACGRSRGRLEVSAAVEAVLVAAAGPEVCVGAPSGGPRCARVADGVVALPWPGDAPWVEVRGACVREVVPWIPVDDP